MHVSEWMDTIQHYVFINAHIGIYIVVQCLIFSLHCRNQIDTAHITRTYFLGRETKEREKIRKIFDFFYLHCSTIDFLGGSVPVHNIFTEIYI